VVVFGTWAAGVAFWATGVAVAGVAACGAGTAGVATTAVGVLAGGVATLFTFATATVPAIVKKDATLSPARSQRLAAAG
jgi:hypothetical protein